MPLHTRFSNSLENAAGIYRSALSFSSDAEQEARTVFNFFDLYGVSCYWYHGNVFRQSGFDIFDCMMFVYCNCENVIILNTPLYRGSEATRFEFDIISNRQQKGRIDIFSLGGADIDIKGDNIFRHSFTAANILDVITEIRS